MVNDSAKDELRFTVRSIYVDHHCGHKRPWPFTPATTYTPCTGILRRRSQGAVQYTLRLFWSRLPRRRVGMWPDYEKGLLRGRTALLRRPSVLIRRAISRGHPSHCPRRLAVSVRYGYLVSAITIST